ncbi:MAG TPA: lytic transglycosylase [Mucilaginibacter sp.]|jgi:membrane-bound lytic murein transglycosylase D|nr:lytic transglycosylase [Mucilaginibacter sp.]
MKRTFTLIICLLSLQIVKAEIGLASPAMPVERQIAALDTIILPVINQPAPLTSESNVFKRRLDSIKKDVPLDYNEYVQSYIDIYARNRGEMGHVLGLTKYYFPIYEKVFRDAGIPDEIKYLSIVESKLDPYAVSRVGATGPWQFMFNTARLYGLNMDDYVDDRRDPIQASYAAAAYLKAAYQEFGDWLLAIASYNCGESNVQRAIEKAGANDFWSIRPYLPVETRGYVPAFIAVAYVMNYYGKHNILPQSCDFSVKTDTVLVNKYVSLSSIARVLDVDLKELTILNPSYTRQIINGTADAPRRLVIPEINKGKYGALYDALNNSNLVAYAPHAAYAPYHESKAEKRPSYHNYITYKVKSGDTLSGIAAKFDGASVEKIRLLNGLKKGSLQPGMTIKISKG